MDAGKARAKSKVTAAAELQVALVESLDSNNYVAMATLT